MKIAGGSIEVMKQIIGRDLFRDHLAHTKVQSITGSESSDKKAA